MLCVRNRQKTEPAPPRPLIVVEVARMNRLTGCVVDAAAFDDERRRPRNDSIMRAGAAVAHTYEICVRFGTSPSRLFPRFSTYFQTQAAARSLDCASTCGARSALFVGRGLQLRAMTALKASLHAPSCSDDSQGRCPGGPVRGPVHGRCSQPRHVCAQMADAENDT